MTIADELSLLANTKSEIKSAIIQKGVEVLDTDPFSVYPDKILQIPSGGYAELTVSGENSITLQNAKANGLNYLKLFGGCEQRNLPEGYTQVEYLQSSGTQWIDTGYYPNNNTTVKTETYITTNPSTIFGSRWSPSPTYDTFGAIIGSGGNLTCYYGTYSDQRYITITDISFDAKHTLEINLNNVIFDGTSYPITRGTFTSTYSMYIGALNDNGTLSENTKMKGRIYPLEVRENGVLVHNYIPARRNSDNVLGMLDLVSQTFLTNQGTGTFTAGANVVPSPDTPIDIVCNNGVLKSSPNLLDKSKFEDNLHWYIKSSSNEITYGGTSNMGVSDWIKVEAGQTYTFSTQATRSGSVLFLTDEYGKRTGLVVSSIVPITAGSSNTYTIPTGYSYIVVQSRSEYFNVDLQIEKGSTATTYMPYGQIYTDGTTETVEIDTTGDTATAENLFKIGTYQDVQEVIAGSVTRNVGVYVITGQENWDYQGNLTNMFSYRTDINARYPSTAISTHYIGVENNTITTNITDGCFKYGYTSTLDKIYIRDNRFNNNLNGFKQWLSDQYQAGTPVIIVFPLGTSTTETVTAQPMNIQAGTNIIEITQASIDPLSLEAKYLAGAVVSTSLTQSRSLDNSVEVTVGE